MSIIGLLPLQLPKKCCVSNQCSPEPSFMKSLGNAVWGWLCLKLSHSSLHLVICLPSHAHTHTQVLTVMCSLITKKRANTKNKSLTCPTKWVLYPISNSVNDCCFHCHGKEGSCHTNVQLLLTARWWGGWSTWHTRKGEKHSSGWRGKSRQNLVAAFNCLIKCC